MSNPFDGPAVPRWPTMLRPTLAVLALLVLATTAAAHGPPAKRDPDFRLLADHNDDCGGDDSGSLSNCHGTHDLVGLDLTEAHDSALGDVVRLRLIANGGSGPLRDVITMKAGGATKTFELRTSDNQAFTGTGFETITVGPARNADGSADGSRILIEGTLKLSALGGKGTTLTDFTVDAYTGDARGDYMPGGYVGPLGNDVADPDQGEGATNFRRTGGYVLQGPAYYATLVFDGPARVASDGTTVVDIEVGNELRNSAQVAALKVTGADGFSATWVGSDGTTAEVDLPKGGSATARLALHGDGHAPTTGTLTLELTTSLGGRSMHTLDYEITAAAGTSQTSEAADKGAPAPAGLLTALALLALAAARRRT